MEASFLFIFSLSIKGWFDNEYLDVFLGSRRFDEHFISPFQYRVNKLKRLLHSVFNIVIISYYSSRNISEGFELAALKAIVATVNHVTAAMVSAANI